MKTSKTNIALRLKTFKLFGKLTVLFWIGMRQTLQAQIITELLQVNSKCVSWEAFLSAWYFCDAILSEC